MFALNAPYNGGTHLPDITVCTPVFDAAGRRIEFWVASRGHHADIGGFDAWFDVAAGDAYRSGGRLYRQYQACRAQPLRRGGDKCLAARRTLAGARHCAQHRRSQGADRRKCQGRRAVARDGGRVLRQDRRCLHAACAGQCGRKLAACHRQFAQRIVRRGAGPEDAYPRADPHRSQAPRCNHRLHRHIAAAGGQFQCAGAGDAGGGSLCLPRHGRRRYSDQRRLLAAARDHRA